MDYQEIFTLPKTIAVVGLSDDPSRASFQVAKYLINKGYAVLPVNPKLNKVLGQKSYPNITSVPVDIKIDIVNVFRRSDQIPFIIKDIIKSHRKPLIWLQEAIENSEAEILASHNNLEMISDLCIMKTHHHYLP